MKVVVIGGYGVFGSLTARLLARDGHQLWLVGRHPEKGRALAQDLNAQTLKLDVGAAPKALFDQKPDVVIDAAGPFQHYRGDPYTIPKLCIANRCRYLDLSDSATFTQGIAALNTDAKEAGVFVLSGASSVPGLSSCIAADLIKGLEDVDTIDIAILPGNRAPRGMSVIKSIVSGVGRQYQQWRDGAWRTTLGWTDRKLYELEPGIIRAGYSVNVPDIALLPDLTGARTVTFRAGLELPVMNGALRLLAQLRQHAWLELPEWAYFSLYMLSQALYPFGSDRGGMEVSVSGKCNGRGVTRKWRLIAEEGHGPFVPGIMCRTILRELPNIKTGARPCLNEVPRPVVEHAMEDLQLRTGVFEHLDPRDTEETVGTINRTLRNQMCQSTAQR